ncbi:DUF397 domain-containing protein [Streptomyces sp. NPDC005963]|uniref:DUF397 domain-containing protein n=1 Tax=Streptomyces sp. NPDC005963 TaxID=3156721 RepID=UPI0033D0CC87
MSENHWQQSSFCQAGNSCVGVMRDGDAILLRESEYPESIVTTTQEKMRDFILGVKNGDFDHLVD